VILLVTAELDPAVHADGGSEKPLVNRIVCLSSAWIAGSSPAMTTKKEKARRNAGRRILIDPHLGMRRALYRSALA
jgi:hypothetical protein